MTQPGHFGDRHELGVTAEHDVCATARHIRGHRHRSFSASLGDDAGLPGVVFCVQHFVAHAILSEHPRKLFALFHTGGSHQHGLAFCVASNDIGNHLAVFCLFVTVNQVGLVFTDHRPIRGNSDHTKFVGAHELGGFCFRRTRHTREFAIQAEIVLQRHGGEGLILRLDFYCFLSFDGLVNTFVISTSGENSPGVLIDDEHLAIHHHIIFVALEEGFGFQGVIQKRDEWRVCGFIQVVDPEIILDFFDTRLQNTNGSLFLIHFVIAINDEPFRNSCKLPKPTVCFTRGGAGNNERCSGLIDEDGVHLIHNGEIVAALNHI